MAINFGIVTPTFNRRVLLRRHLRRVTLQTYSHWRLLVVHDGPNPSMRSMVEGFRESDERIGYLETKVPASDAGVTPRLEGVRAFAAANPVPDYVVFWDDDNAYSVDALRRIAISLEEAEWPDLLLVGVKYGTRIVPPADAPIRSLKVGEIDTASLVFRPLLALDAYEGVQKRAEVDRNDVLFLNDFLAYDHVNQLLPLRSIKRDSGIIICQHDGLRWGPFIRHALGIPPLGLARFVGLGR
jgi:glycosyltransferase involved in cell wall biosynthesis